MNAQTRIANPLTLTKILIVFCVLASSINVCAAHVSVGIGFGVPAYAPAPVYYGPPPGYYYGGPGPYAEPYPDDEVTTTDVEWVPSHLEDGVWVPGRYVQYIRTAPGPDYIWVDGYWDSHHHWRHGHWRHGYRD